ncbi:MAG: ABC transporter ATP-binding protein [Clostridia bacterium]|nr:ABC transporter ATP-binding protein [Clostridia bacterium]
MNERFKTEGLSVGYGGKALIRDIDIALGRGRIMTLIGPNGSGKSTILKTVSRQIAKLRGAVLLDGSEVFSLGQKELAKRQAVVLTDRVRPELTTVREIVSLGRYPYTNAVGRLTPEDRRIVGEALSRVSAAELAGSDFATLSDGQKQRVILARALAQEPELLILDEPTAFLDIKHKTELLSILRELARERGMSVIMSLHETDLAAKASDLLVCVKGETIAAFGTPDEVLGRQTTIEELYGLEKGAYDPLLGSVELQRPEGEPSVFVIGGAGYGTPVYRRLQRGRIPFATGILFENDVDARTASSLAAETVVCPAFHPMDEAMFARAMELMLSCGRAIDAGAPRGPLNEMNGRLADEARKRGLLINERSGELL